jgi:hypothetical protein
MYAPCENDGCCISIVEMCWNNATQTAEVVNETLQYSTSENCENTTPLYNPFDVPIYGPEWEVNPPSPCRKSCYIDN